MSRVRTAAAETHTHTKREHTEHKRARERERAEADLSVVDAPEAVELEDLLVPRSNGHHLSVGLVPHNVVDEVQSHRRPVPLRSVTAHYSHREAEKQSTRKRRIEMEKRAYVMCSSGSVHSTFLNPGMKTPR